MSNGTVSFLLVLYLLAVGAYAIWLPSPWPRTWKSPPRPQSRSQSKRESLPFFLVLAYMLLLGLGLWNIQHRVTQRGWGGSFRGSSHKLSWWLVPLDLNRFRYRVTRDLPANHRLTEADLALPQAGDSAPPFWLPPRTDILGRYLSSALSSGSIILPTNLLAEPCVYIAPRTRLLLVDLALQPSLAQSLEPGDAVMLHGGSETFVHGVKVVAMYGRDSRSNSAALLAIPEPQFWLISTNKQDSLFVLHEKQD